MTLPKIKIPAKIFAESVYFLPLRIAEFFPSYRYRIQKWSDEQIRSFLLTALKLSERIVKLGDCYMCPNGEAKVFVHNGRFMCTYQRIFCEHALAALIKESFENAAQKAT